MKTSLKVRVLRVGIGTLVFFIATVLPAKAQIKVRLCWTSFASNMSGSWVAYEEGFFKKNGLDVELIHIPSTSRAIQAMLAGEMAFSYTDGRTAVQAALKGVDVVMLAGAANRFVFSFMARPEIKRISDLKGKKIGITRIGSSTYTVTQWVMSHAGVKPDEYQLLQLVDVPNMMTADASGTRRCRSAVAADQFSRAQSRAERACGSLERRSGICFGGDRVNSFLRQSQ